MHSHRPVLPEPTEQHVDMTSSSVIVDNLNMEKLRDWFAEHPQFLGNKKIAPVTTAGKIGYEEVGFCQTAREIVIACMKKIVRQTFEIGYLDNNFRKITVDSLTQF